MTLFTRASKNITRGYLTIFTVIFASVFMAFLVTFANYILAEKTVQQEQQYAATALAAAEAGAQYFLWHLASFPSDLSAVQAHQVVDAEGSSDSSFSLSVSSASACGMRTAVYVVSSGIASSAPAYPETVNATFAQPTLFASTTPNVSLAAPNFTILKNIAAASGVYVPYSNAYGYQIVFNADGSFDARTVTAVTPVDGYSTQGGWRTERSVIATTGSSTHYAIPSCPVIFVADNAWVSGVVRGKATLAAANIGSTTDASIFLPGNLTYQASTGDGLVLVAQGSVLITLNSPDVLSLAGGFIAANGSFGRNEYLASGTHAVPASLSSYVLRTSLSLMGQGIARYATTTKWVDGSNAFISGYAARTDAFDRMLVAAPPAMTPTTTSAFRIVEWREQ